MKILNELEGLVTNFEIYQLISQQKDQNMNNKEIIDFEKKVIEYISNTPINNIKENSFRECLKILNKYNLTKAEKLQLLNWKPTTEVEINLIVEECAERLSEEQTLQLIEDINSTLL